jgi:hypothetical protein
MINGSGLMLDPKSCHMSHELRTECQHSILDDSKVTGERKIFGIDTKSSRKKVVHHSHNLFFSKASNLRKPPNKSFVTSFTHPHFI